MMRRTPLRRSGSLRRRTWMRARRKEPRRESRVRDSAYLAFVRHLPCIARELGRCEGRIQPDHTGRRGYGQKCDDAITFPLCELHHRQRTDFSGPFRNWNQEQMRAWLADHTAKTQAFARSQGVLP